MSVQSASFASNAALTACVMFAVTTAACGSSHHSTPPPGDDDGDASPIAYTITVGTPETLIPADTPNYLFFPDEHLAYVREDDGSDRVWITGNGGTYVFTTADFVTFTPLVGSQDAPTQVLTPSHDNSDTTFDGDYSGSGTVFRAQDGHDLLMIYHGENHMFSGVNSGGNPFYASIGLARSSDEGLTWTRQGQIISAHDPKNENATKGGAGAATPSAIIVDDWIYMVFRELDTSEPQGIAIARAPVSGDAAAGTWKKYYNGDFTEDGLGGSFTALAITLDPAVAGDRRQPEISFNTYMSQYVITVVGNGGIYATMSSDLLTWSTGQVILATPVPDGTVTPSTAPFNWYQTLTSPATQPNERLTDASGYLYYAHGEGTGTSHHTLVRAPFTVTP